ncbi:hypothetical protein CDAR_123161 [Caerostris darwini]|uniref:Uncharacterized protein n=1 Tax=Caerostris darwini TaxID=1538125 RepID=A0AAV4QB58_9ARAC|nr:hypothetical protein CDAR_123161 [Caerostris darwini]
MAVLLLASSLTSGDVSHTVKGVHKHTFLVYTESKDKKEGVPSLTPGWPNTGHEVIEWPFQVGDDNSKWPSLPFGDSIRWPNMGSSHVEPVKRDKPTMQPSEILKEPVVESDSTSQLLKQLADMNKVIAASKKFQNSENTTKSAVKPGNPKDMVASTNDSSPNDEDDDYYEEMLDGENDEDSDELPFFRSQTAQKGADFSQMHGVLHICPEDMKYLTEMFGNTGQRSSENGNKGIRLIVDPGELEKTSSHRSLRLSSGNKANKTRKTRLGHRLGRKLPRPKFRLLSIFRKSSR